MFAPLVKLSRSAGYAPAAADPKEAAADEGADEDERWPWEEGGDGIADGGAAGKLSGGRVAPPELDPPNGTQAL